MVDASTINARNTFYPIYQWMSDAIWTPDGADRVIIKGGESLARVTRVYFAKYIWLRYP